MPDLPAGACINRPDVIGQCEVHHTVDHEWSRFDRCIEITARYGAKHPGETERADVGLVDLPKRAVTAARIIAVVCGPGVRRRLKQLGWSERSLAKCDH